MASTIAEQDRLEDARQLSLNAQAVLLRCAPAGGRQTHEFTSTIAEQDRLEDARQLFLNAQAVLLRCTPAVRVSPTPTERRGRWHYSFAEVKRRGQNTRKPSWQYRVSDVSFATAVEANCWHVKSLFAEKLLSSRSEFFFFVCEWFVVVQVFCGWVVGWLRKLMNFCC